MPPEEQNSSRTDLVVLAIVLYRLLWFIVPKEGRESVCPSSLNRFLKWTAKLRFVKREKARELSSELMTQLIVIWKERLSWKLPLLISFCSILYNCVHALVFSLYIQGQLLTETLGRFFHHQNLVEVANWWCLPAHLHLHIIIHTGVV